MTFRKRKEKALSENEENLRSRFRSAAIKLFVDQGFDRTTTAQIAHSVGVADRTFYRYYPDKRDVLFEGEAAVRSLLVAAVTSTPPEIGPLDTVLRALRMFQMVLEVFRPFAKARHDLILATPALQEREAIRTEALIALLGTALGGRGVPPGPAELAAKVGMAAFVVAAHDWLDNDDLELSKCIETSFAELRMLLTAMPSRPDQCALPTVS